MVETESLGRWQWFEFIYSSSRAADDGLVEK